MSNIKRKLWILAGETSGDIYGAKLAEESYALSKDSNIDLEISGMGSNKMREANVNILVDSTELGVMGIIEISKLLFVFIRIYFQLVKKAKKERPDAVVLIDYPGFNLLFALAMYFNKIKVIWYVSPQIWVWGKWRKPVLEKICNKMLVIFPFEAEEVYNKQILDVEFVGHPLLEIVYARLSKDIERDKNCFVLMPGSRKSEITRLLVPMLDVVREVHPKHQNLNFVVSASREKMYNLCNQIIEKYRKKHSDLPEIEVNYGKTNYYQQKATAGIAASGTVTVESAISGLPLVVIYKMNFFTILLALVLVKLYRGYFTMVNIILNKTVYEEFVQYKVCNKYLVPAVEKILPNGSRRQEIEDEMKELVNALSSDNCKPSLAAAQACIKSIS